jgi:hypothetical protein
MEFSEKLASETGTLSSFWGPCAAGSTFIVSQNEKLFPRQAKTGSTDRDEVPRRLKSLQESAKLSRLQ